MKKIKLLFLKHKAKKLWVEICNQRDSLSCGESLEDVISPYLWSCKDRFKIVWDKIELLDPNAPKNPVENR